MNDTQEYIQRLTFSQNFTALRGLIEYKLWIYFNNLLLCICVKRRIKFFGVENMESKKGFSFTLLSITESFFTSVLYLEILFYHSSCSHYFCCKGHPFHTDLFLRKTFPLMFCVGLNSVNLIVWILFVWKINLYHNLTHLLSSEVEVRVRDWYVALLIVLNQSKFLYILFTFSRLYRPDDGWH